MKGRRVMEGATAGRERPGLPGGRMAWVVVPALIALAFIAAACGQADAPETMPETTADGTTYTVGVDGSTEELNAMFLRFFPDSLTVHPGDTIVFQPPENGELHTVTFGTDVPTEDPGTGEVTQLGERRVWGGNFFEDGFGSPPRADTSMPCFLAEGLPPSEGCAPEQQEPAAFDGTQSWFNSGGLLGDEEFSLELADDIAPGRYTFVCLVHTPVMKGEIEVVEPGQPAEDPAEVVARGSKELQQQVGLVRALVERPPTLDEGEVEAFRALFPTQAAGATTFFPEEIEIPVGGTVTWQVLGDHTISFNAPEGAAPFYERAEDGSVRENELGAEPSGDFGGWDGSGVLNSGLLSGHGEDHRFNPPDEFSVTFTRAGMYSYQCLIHPDMEGKVKVGG